MEEEPNNLKSHFSDDASIYALDLEVAVLAAAEPEICHELTVATVMAYANVATVSEFARRANVSRTTVYRWMRSGLDAYTADELAIRVAHAHPACVFGHTWFTAQPRALAA